MINYKLYTGHEKITKGKRNKYDNNIYTFDIETTSYFIYNNKIYNNIDYLKLNEKEKKEVIKKCCMYIWMFSINEQVFFGRTWDEFIEFLDIIEEYIPEKKYIFVHNLAFEFQFLKSVFDIKDMFARKKRKPIKFSLEDYNIEFRCSYMMSNCALKYLPELFNLPVKKLTGELDYNKIRHSKTNLTKEELAYCENDCLVVYYYILEELKTYETVKDLPLTSTGHVRRELQQLVSRDYTYKNKVRKSININPHIYNLLNQAFMGGFTHSNWIYTDKIIKNVTSFDFTSSYPYVMTTFRYPASEFKKCNLKTEKQMLKKFAYILVVKFKNISSKYFTTYISQSKCRNITGGRYDNGRVISAEELTITLTDVDFRLILDMYNCEYEILESYYSQYAYLPIEFINFILEKYVKKTKYKGVKEKELEYQKEKNKFNSLYGMTVTNTIRNEVDFENNIKEWTERELTNNEILELLEKDKKNAFLSYSYGVWVTAHARNNLLRNVIKLDKYCIYCDTDSMKLREGFDISVIENYNNQVKKRIQNVSKLLNIDIEKYAPKDIKDQKRMLGLFEKDEEYREFITQGAKKYAYTKIENINKVKNYEHIIEKIDKDTVKILGITVSGVPKKRKYAT